MIYALKYNSKESFMTCFLLFWCMYAGHVLDKPWYEKQCFIPVNLLSLKIV